MEERSKRRDTMLKSVRDGSAWTVQEKFGTEYLNAFIVALGFSGSQLSFLITIPQAATALVQMASQVLIERFGRLRVLADAIFMQAMALALTIVAGAATISGFPLPAALPLFAILLTMFFSAGAIAGNAWVSLMGDVIPAKARNRFFAMRARINSITAIGALVVAGAVFQFGQAFGTWVFLGLFVVAAIARLVSWRIIKSFYDPGGEKLEKEERFTFFQFLFRRSNFVRFALFTSLYWVAIYVSAPFIAYYLLEELGFSLVQYTGLALAVLIGSLVSLKTLARLSDEYGNRAMFFVSGGLIGAYVLSFAFFESYWVFLALHFIGGIVWSGFNLGTSNYVYDAVTPKKRALVNSYATALKGAGILAGGALSAILFESFTQLSLSLGEYQMIFVSSGSLRILLVLAFIPLVREVRPQGGSISKLVFVNAGMGIRYAAHTVIATTTKPIKLAKRRFEQLEEKELDEALKDSEEDDKK